VEQLLVGLHAAFNFDLIAFHKPHFETFSRLGLGSITKPRVLRAFRARSWREAKEKFDYCISLLGDDPLSRHFLNLCSEYAVHPPDGSWAGVIAMEEK
jgi:hypothetical protein